MNVEKWANILLKNLAVVASQDLKYVWPFFKVDG